MPLGLCTLYGRVVMSMVHIDSSTALRTLRELGDIVCSHLANALSGRLDGRVEALGQLVSRLAEVEAG